MQKTDMLELSRLLGNIDIYLLDQILKGRFEPHHQILDAGCGEGRNLLYFIQNGFNVFGLDKNSEAIHKLKNHIKSIDENYPLDRVMIGNTKDLPYSSHEFDTIISSAVLHFAESREQFLVMFAELVRVLKPGGMLFVRMACDVGMGNSIKPMGFGTYFLPDGTVRFLLTKALLQEIMEKYDLEFIEPFKTVVVDEKRSMSILVLRKT